MYTFGMSDKLDPTHQLFVGKFGYESFVIENGEYIKDLTYLNRDLKKVIVLEKDPNVMKKHPDNAIFLSEFKGEADDKELFELMPFLEYLAKPEIKDV